MKKKKELTRCVQPRLAHLLFQGVEGRLYSSGDGGVQLVVRGRARRPLLLREVLVIVVREAIFEGRRYVFEGGDMWCFSCFGWWARHTCRRKEERNPPNDVYGINSHPAYVGMEARRNNGSQQGRVRTNHYSPAFFARLLNGHNGHQEVLFSTKNAQQNNVPKRTYTSIKGRNSETRSHYTKVMLQLIANTPPRRRRPPSSRPPNTSTAARACPRAGPKGPPPLSRHPP